MVTDQVGRLQEPRNGTHTQPTVRQRAATSMSWTPSMCRQPPAGSGRPVTPFTLQLQLKSDQDGLLHLGEAAVAVIDAEGDAAVAVAARACRLAIRATTQELVATL